MKSPEKFFVQSTKEYDQFKLLSANRQIDDSHVRTLKMSFMNGYILNPIVVNEKNEIIDGQHRYFAARELGLPIYYIEVPGLNIKDCIRLNLKQVNWKERDFVDCYAAQGDSNYIRLQNVMNAWNVSVRTPLYVCHRSARMGATAEAPKGKMPLKDGNLSFSERDVAVFTEKYPKIVDVARALDTPVTAIFILAMTKALENTEYNHDKMIANAENYGADLWKKRVDVKGTMEELSNVYNFRTRREVHFEDVLRRGA